MNDFWNVRYSNQKYAYGEEPNNFVKQELNNLKPGKILFPAEGEGRNAVYAATLGWDVTAFDPSTAGKEKAELLARKYNTKLNYKISDYETIQFPAGSFDCIVLVFAHMSPQKRKEYHQKLISFLKPGGTLLLIGFSKEQIKNNTGGPQNSAMLFSEQELQNDFAEMAALNIIETETTLDEGTHHQGTASVIHVIGKR